MFRDDFEEYEEKRSLLETRKEDGFDWFFNQLFSTTLPLQRLLLQSRACGCTVNLLSNESTMQSVCGKLVEKTCRIQLVDKNSPRKFH